RRKEEFAASASTNMLVIGLEWGLDKTWGGRCRPPQLKSSDIDVVVAQRLDLGRGALENPGRRVLLVLAAPPRFLNRRLEITPCIIELRHHLREVAVGVRPRPPARTSAAMRRALAKIRA